MKARVAVLAGDGIGPEVIAEGLRCLHAIASLFGHEFELTLLPFGGVAIESHADPLPESTLSACLAADAVLLGAIGGPKWSAPQAALRPEEGLLRLRAALGTFANLRPVKVHAALADASTLRPRSCTGSICCSCASSPAAFTSATSTATRTAPPTCAATSPPRSSASRASLGAWRSHGGAGSPRSTRRTYWRLHGCGARCARGSWRANSPNSPSSTCWWTRRPCT